MEKAVTMKTNVFTLCTLLLFSFFAVSCDDVPKGDYKSFDYKLQGTWVSNDPSVYAGTLEIGYDTIKITDYAESQTGTGDDNQRPFKNYTKNVSFNGYSQDGKIFIEEGSYANTGIPYTYSEGSYPSFTKILEFTFGGRAEKLVKTE